MTTTCLGRIGELDVATVRLGDDGQIVNGISSVAIVRERHRRER